MGIAPLDGVKVLEIATTVAGPAAGRILADFGADVFKLEAPDGDHLRSWGACAPDGTSWWFKSHNRNKRFVAFDLHDPRDVAEVRRFALECDVLLENFRPGRLAAWGLGYEELAAERPDLIYVSISGYGQDGPYASRPGFGHIAESLSGVRYVTGYPDRPPVRMGLSIGDEIAGIYAAMGTLLALRARDAGGGGDHVDVSLVESLFSLTEGLLPDFAHAGFVSSAWAIVTCGRRRAARTPRKTGSSLRSLPTRDRSLSACATFWADPNSQTMRASFPIPTALRTSLSSMR